MNSGVTMHDLLDQVLGMSRCSDSFAHPGSAFVSSLDFSDVSGKIWLLIFLRRRTKEGVSWHRTKSGGMSRTPDFDSVAYLWQILVSGRTRLDTQRLQKQKTKMHHGSLLSIL